MPDQAAPPPSAEWEELEFQQEFHDTRERLKGWWHDQGFVSNDESTRANDNIFLIGLAVLRLQYEAVLRVNAENAATLLEYSRKVKIIGLRSTGQWSGGYRQLVNQELPGSEPDDTELVALAAEMMLTQADANDKADQLFEHATSLLEQSSHRLIERDYELVSHLVTKWVISQNLGISYHDRDMRRLETHQMIEAEASDPTSPAWNAIMELLF